MFLNQLSIQEKKMFLDLAIHVAKANDVLAAEEKAMISEYCNEMQLPAIELFETQPFETVVEYFSLADEHIKKVVLLEILGLAFVDGSFDEDEKKIVSVIVEKLGVSADVYENIKSKILDYYGLCAELAAICE